MDECDQGNIQAERFLKQAVGRVLAHRVTRPSLTHCRDCGEPIPEKRRKAMPGYKRCVACQMEYEGNHAND
jgi:phage/conjugal plasmid C-4 type zinc finger TraR family protein